MENFKRILVVSRLTQYSADAVQAGISLAKSFGAELKVLHLITNPVDQQALNAPLPYKDERHKSYASLQQEEKEELEKVLRREMGTNYPVNIIVREGKPGDEVPKVVRDEQIDLIVMLAHEEGRLEHWLFGREEDQVVRRMPCSILLIKKEPGPVKW
jgi:nucleotide-binding universal stress UspA family protein